MERRQIREHQIYEWPINYKLRIKTVQLQDILKTKTYIEFEVAARFLDGHASFFESEVTSVIVIQNGDTSSLIFANFEFGSNTTTGLEGTRVIENT